MEILLFAATPLVVIISLIITAFIANLNWPGKYRKHLLFSLIGSLLIFPVALPAGTISVIFMPNIMALIFILFVGDNIFEFIMFLLKAWKFSLPSLLITAMLIHMLGDFIRFKETASEEVEK